MLRRFVSGAAQAAVRSTDTIVPTQQSALSQALVLRSLFYVKQAKVHEPNRWLKSVAADAFILDLEDSVPAGQKKEARRRLRSVLPTIPPSHQQLLIRLNNPSLSPYEWIEDLRTAHERLLGFIVPKATVDDIIACDHALGAIESEKGLPIGHIKLFPMLETARGVEDSVHVARASLRNVALMIGRYDLQRSLGCSKDSAILTQAYQQVLMAAKGAGIAAIASVNCDLDNYNLYERECAMYYKAGFTGRSALTAAQAIIANREFTIGTADRQMSEAAQLLAGSGSLKVSTNRSMFGPPHMRRATDLASLISAQDDVDRTKKSNVKQTGSFEFPTLLCPKASQVALSVKEECKDGWQYSPFCATVTDGLVAVWEQNFLQNSSLTSKHFVRHWGFDEAFAPFSLLFNLAMSLSVVVFSYNAKVHLELVSTRQMKPIHVNERLSNRIRVLGIEPKGAAGDIVTSEHQLLNEGGDAVFSVIKKTLFPTGAISMPQNIREDSASSQELVNPIEDHFLNMVSMKKQTKPIEIKTGQVFVHEMVKVFGPHDAVTLSYLLKGVNPLHVNSHRFAHDELLISGPCVLAATIANQGFDMGDILTDQLTNVVAANKTNNGDMISTISRVIDITKLSDTIQKVTMRVLGVRNVDPAEVARHAIPARLFEPNQRPKDIEKICAESCPVLYHRIVTHGTRTFLRASQ